MEVVDKSLTSVENQNIPYGYTTKIIEETYDVVEDVHGISVDQGRYFKLNERIRETPSSEQENVYKRYELSDFLEILIMLL